MEEILDGHYAHDYKKLEFSSEGTGLLSVDLNFWKKELIRLERKTNKGCAIYFLVYFIGIPALGLKGLGGNIYLILLLSPLIYKLINAFLFMNLVRHGWYEYEIYSDKIVRYTNTNYRSLDWSDCRKIKITNYGILIERKWRSWNFLKNRFNEELIIIPNKVQGYDQIVNYLTEKKITR